MVDGGSPSELTGGYPGEWDHAFPGIANLPEDFGELLMMGLEGLQELRVEVRRHGPPVSS